MKPWTPSFWIAAGMILIILEILLPGEFFIWFAVSAFVTSAVTGLGVGWQGQIAAFAIGSLMAVGLFFLRLKQRVSTPQKVNIWRQRLLGKTGKAAEDIPAGGTGNVAVAGSLWLVQAKTDIIKGQPVTIVGFKEDLPLVEASLQSIQLQNNGD